MQQISSKNKNCKWAVEFTGNYLKIDVCKYMCRYKQFLLTRWTNSELHALFSSYALDYGDPCSVVLHVHYLTE